MLPTLLSILALAIAIFAFLRSGSGAGSGGAGEDSARDARRSLAAEQERLAERQQALERWLAMFIAGDPPTPQMMEDGQYFFEVNGEDARKIAQAKQATWIDVRTENEIQAGMIPGAKWIPMDQIEERLEELPKDQCMIVYCAGGVRSASVCQFLATQGFQGGMSAWNGSTVRP